MKKIRIGCDMDGICVDLLRLWLEEINADHGLEVCADDIPFWAMEKCEKLKHLGLDCIVDYLRRPNFFERALPIAGSVVSLSYLSAIGHEITMITATPGRWGPDVDKDVQEQKKRWIQRWMSYLHLKNIVFPSAAEKVKHEFDVFIDDRPETLIAYREAHPKALVCGIEYPYNRHAGDHARRIYLAKDHNDTVAAWNNIVDLIEKHAHA